MKMTKRDVLKTAIEFYGGGGKPGFSEYGLGWGSTQCSYLTPDGGRCAIGTLMPKMGFTDEHITREFDGEAVISLRDDLLPHVEDDLFWSDVRGCFLWRMQVVHDRMNPFCMGSDVAAALKEFADEEGVEL